MNIHTQAVHAGDRKRAGAHIPVSTPIYTAASYFYEHTETLDRIFGHEEHGESYARYGNPTNTALEELIAALENGHGALACASGMAALEISILTALLDRPRSVLAAEALYGATINLLLRVFEPAGTRIRFVDIYDQAGFEAALAEERTGCVLVETISNPLLRVADLERIARLARQARAALLVDSTFATPLLVRPLDLGAHLVVHSATKYLAGHGDVLGGLVVSGDEHFETLRTLSRTCGPVLGPFESYLTMRGIKTFPLRMERQCASAARIAEWLAGHPRIERVHYPGRAGHPDAALAGRLFPPGLAGGMVSFEIRGAERADVFRFMDSLKLVVRATSLGDVHSMLLYPAISSHREIPPDIRKRTGIRDNLVRLSTGIEAPEDIIADLDQALGA